MTITTATGSSSIPAVGGDIRVLVIVVVVVAVVVVLFCRGKSKTKSVVAFRFYSFMENKTLIQKNVYILVSFLYDGYSMI